MQAERNEQQAARWNERTADTALRTASVLTLSLGTPRIVGTGGGLMAVEVRISPSAYLLVSGNEEDERDGWQVGLYYYGEDEGGLLTERPTGDHELRDVVVRAMLAVQERERGRGHV